MPLCVCLTGLARSRQRKTGGTAVGTTSGQGGCAFLRGGGSTGRGLSVLASSMFRGCGQASFYVQVVEE